MREHTTLQLLLESRTLKDAKRVVNMLVGMGFGWMPLGEKEGNFGLVNIGSDPGFAFIERITNALDALIDEAARRAPPAVVAELSSPRAAVAARGGRRTLCDPRRAHDSSCARAPGADRARSHRDDWRRHGVCATVARGPR
jgi:hypothetical protein